MQEETGQTILKNALILVLITVVVIGVSKILGMDIHSIFTFIRNSLSK